MKQRINLEAEVADLLRSKMEEFLAWCAENWTVTPEEAVRDNIFDTKPDGYREGYNAAVEGLQGALDCWIEDQ